MSIHDVTPALEPQVRELWALCRAHAVVPALLVVPDWHGGWPLLSHRAFVAWVLRCAGDGAEIVLHGERHDEAGLPRGVRDSLRAFGRTAREGEFLTLGVDAATERIERGLLLLRSVGFQPVGFIPPAWLAREDTHVAVARAGLHFSEDAVSVRVHDASGRSVRLRAPALRWSGRSTARAVTSSMMARVRWRTQRDAPLVRLALHPQDLSHPATARSVARELSRWTRARALVRYGDL